MSKEALLGDEAIALGAIHAGISAAFSYPGTPASEIMGYLIRASQDPKINKNNFYASWSVNEKTAYEEALGVSFSGKRALVSFKHVGLNVAADPFVNSAITGANGGLVVAVADDPGMHSSQNEQDSRFFGRFAGILCFEPSDQQEAYDLTREAFEASEKFGLPVLIRLVTRLAHSRSEVSLSDTVLEPKPLHPGQWQDWTLLPVNARRRFEILLSTQPDLLAYSENSSSNQLSVDGDKTLGVIASGIAINYLLEVFRQSGRLHPYLKISAYPLPINKLRRLIGEVEKVLVLEDGYPFIESEIQGLLGLPGKTIHGRLDGTIPRAGELNPESVRKALGLGPLNSKGKPDLKLPPRPPQLCAGCPHTDTFRALKEALESYPQANIFSDIGCYTLGALPPWNAIQTCVCMGASIGMAHGAAAVGVHPSIAVIGDSTFAHSGITPLLSAAESQANITVFILDNSTVAMTGGQKSFGTGQRLVEIVKGVGVHPDHIRVITPLPKHHNANIRVIKEELEFKGTSVIIPDRECVQYPQKKGAS